MRRRQRRCVFSFRHVRWKVHLSGVNATRRERASVAPHRVRSPSTSASVGTPGQFMSAPNLRSAASAPYTSVRFSDIASAAADATSYSTFPSP